MKCLWFIYLKKFGYAFVDDPATGSNSPAPVTPLPRNRKRVRHSGDDDSLPTTKRPRASVKSCSDKGEEAAVGAVVFDKFPADNLFFFECSQDSIVEGSEVGGLSNDGKKLSGYELFLLNRTRRQSNVRSFSVRYTIGLLYLGLQYTHQKILLPDLTR